MACPHRDYHRHRARQIAAGAWQPWADPAPVRDHVQNLLQAATFQAVGDAAAVGPMTVWEIAHGTETAPCPDCGHPCLRPVGEVYLCLSCETRARLTAAGFTPGSPAIQRIAEWNQAVTHRGDCQQGRPQPQPVPDTSGPGAVEGPDREKEAGG